MNALLTGQGSVVRDGTFQVTSENPGGLKICVATREHPTLDAHFAYLAGVQLAVQSVLGAAKSGHSTVSSEGWVVGVSVVVVATSLLTVAIVCRHRKRMMTSVDVMGRGSVSPTSSTIGTPSQAVEMSTLNDAALAAAQSEPPRYVHTMGGLQPSVDMDDVVNAGDSKTKAEPHAVEAQGGSHHVHAHAASALAGASSTIPGLLHV